MHLCLCLPQELETVKARITAEVNARAFAEKNAQKYQKRAETYRADMSTYWLLPLFRSTPGTAAK